MYACCEMTANGHANPGKIQQIDVSALSDEILERCYRRVSKKYEKLAERDAKNGEKDYDSVAKGPGLLRSLELELRRRFNKKKAKTQS